MSYERSNYLVSMACKNLSYGKRSGYYHRKFRSIRDSNEYILNSYGKNYINSYMQSVRGLYLLCLIG